MFAVAAVYDRRSIISAKNATLTERRYKETARM